MKNTLYFLARFWVATEIATHRALDFLENFSDGIYVFWCRFLDLLLGDFVYRDKLYRIIRGGAVVDDLMRQAVLTVYRTYRFYPRWNLYLFDDFDFQVEVDASVVLDTDYEDLDIFAGGMDVDELFSSIAGL